MLSRPKVLVIDEEVPWPAHSGKRIRTLNLLTRLAPHFGLDLLVHKNGATAEARRALADRGVNVIVANSAVPPKRGLLFPFRLSLSLLRGWPYSVASHQRRAYRRTLNGLLSLRRYDLVHCEWSPYAQYLWGARRPVVVAAHNVEWRIWDRLAEAATSGAHRLLFHVQARLMERFERRVYATFPHATAVSDGDAQVIRELGCPDVTTVANGVDTEYYRPGGHITEEPNSLVFTGAMDWRANEYSVKWFLSEVHPQLRARGLDYRLYLVGKNPPAWLCRRDGIPAEVVISGTVADVRPWIERGAVFVVPLRVGGGSRLKILEALAMRRPVVSTSVGAEGLDVVDGRHLVLADSPSDFADAIASLMQSPERRRRLGAEGRTLVEAQYRWEAIATVQGDIWQRAMSGAAGERRSAWRHAASSREPSHVHAP